MIDNYKKKILIKLVTKFENSKSFIGQNQVSQSFSVRISKLFKDYLEPSEYKLNEDVNEAVTELKDLKLVTAKLSSNHLYDKVFLNVEALDDIYNFLGINSKEKMNNQLFTMLKDYKEENYILSNYCEKQLYRLKINKPVKFFAGDFEEFDKILFAVKRILEINMELYIREFSIECYGDSKYFDKIKSKVESILCDYGDYKDKPTILENYNIVRTPTYVNFKGNAIVNINNQKINLNLLNSDIGVSSVMLQSINSIKVKAKKVITIENLTSFHRFNDRDYFVIYLGGFHNEVRRNFIKKLFNNNKDILYYHFGDIDAGGFYILNHLKVMTGVDFKPFKMDVETLSTHKKYTKCLTENDRVRLNQLKGSTFDQVIDYMLEKNCKLEQESIIDEELLSLQ